MAKKILIFKGLVVIVVVSSYYKELFLVQKYRLDIETSGHSSFNLFYLKNFCKAHWKGRPCYHFVFWILCIFHSVDDFSCVSCPPFWFRLKRQNLLFYESKPYEILYECNSSSLQTTTPNYFNIFNEKHFSAETDSWWKTASL